MSFIHTRWFRQLVGYGVLGCVGMIVGCSDLTNAPPLPAGTDAPAVFETPEGATAMYNAVRVHAVKAFAEAVLAGGLISDEIRMNESEFIYPIGPDVSLTYFRRLAIRSTPEAANSQEDNAYEALQGVRGRSAQTRGILARYGASLPTSFRGELYALAGYAEILLADLYCSGIPLSTLDFEGDFTYKAGSNTQDVYLHAAALFDTALTLAGDSLRITQLAAVGKARSLLSIGQYKEAAAAVRDVNITFQYAPLILWLHRTLYGENGLWPITVVIADGEGGNGLPFRSSGDPRTPVDIVRSVANPWFPPWAMPHKYASTTSQPFVLADGIEAQLILAEAALNDGVSTWLPTLNALRTDGTFTTAPNPSAPGGIDTTWHAGTGGIDGLRPLTDPGTNAARIRLLFAERAAWQFATGHRQGDLRRLVRQYSLRPETVYPTGVYQYGGRQYGQDVNLPIPDTERANPHFTGCLDRNA